MLGDDNKNLSKRTRSNRSFKQNLNDEVNNNN